MPIQAGSPSNRNDAAVGGAFTSSASRASRAADITFPLLLALADDEDAPAAIRVTAALADAKGAVPTVLRALGDIRPAEASLAPLAGSVLEEALDASYVETCRNALRAHVTAVVGPVGWPLEVNEQAPIDAIIEQVRNLRAGLIVMGLRRHGVLRRVIARDLLAEVLRAARVPVLAVRPDITSLPKRAVVAIDFSRASIRAAQLARQLLADDGALCLVHVSPGNSDETRARLERIIDELAPAPGMTMTSILLHGDIQASIEGFAQAVSADLLAMGSGHHGFLDRLTDGRISMKLAHTARWSTLIVPAGRDD
ncbi:MAG: universal stress protein [Gemmatimonadaceae bacterium]|nr:universal stress protein [Gemmatimonadaceae bacterium]